MKVPPISIWQHWERDGVTAHHCPSNDAEPVIVDQHVVPWGYHCRLPLLSRAKVVVEEKSVARVLPWEWWVPPSFSTGSNPKARMMKQVRWRRPICAYLCSERYAGHLASRPPSHLFLLSAHPQRMKTSCSEGHSRTPQSRGS